MMRVGFLTLMILLGGVHVSFAAVAGQVQKANKAFAQEKFDEAANQYRQLLQKNSESEILNYNLGTTLYKMGEYEESVQHLQKALLSEEPVLKEQAHYNLGNALYHSGIGKARSDINMAVASLEKSLKQYEEAIRLDAQDADAKYNYEFVKKELERLKQQRQQQQQQQQNQQQPSKDQEKQDKDKQDKDKQEQSQQEQQQDQSQDQQNKDEQQPQEEQQNDQPPQDQEQDQNSEQPPSDREPSDESPENPEDGEDQDDHGDEGEPKDDEAPEKEPAGDENKPEPDYNNQTPQGTQGKDAGELTEEEAQMLLRGYQQTEAPQKLLNVFRKSQTVPVEKDW